MNRGWVNSSCGRSWPARTSEAQLAASLSHAAATAASSILLIRKAPPSLEVSGGKEPTSVHHERTSLQIDGYVHIADAIFGLCAGSPASRGAWYGRASHATEC